MIQDLENDLGCRATVKRLPPRAGDVPSTWAELKKSNARRGHRPQAILPNGLAHFADRRETRPGRPAEVAAV
jgi:hypothetical protein